MNEGQKGLKQLLGESFGFFREHWRRLSVVTLFVYVPLETLAVLFFVFFGIEPGTKKTTFSTEESLLRLLFSLISAVFYLFYQVAILKTIESSDKKNGITASSAYGEAFSLFWPLLGVVLRVVVRVILWSLLLIIPGIIFAIFYSFANMAFLFDGKKGYEALIFSKQIVKPYLGKFLGNSFVAILVLLPVYIFITIILSLIFGGYDPKEPTLSGVIGVGVGNIASALASIYLLIFFYHLYKELKSRRGGVS